MAPPTHCQGGFFMLQKLMNLFVLGIEKDGAMEYNLTTLGNVSIVILILVLLLAIAIFSGSGKKMKTQELIFCSVSIALAMITSFMKFGSLPFGGSITFFSMMFICLIGYLYGVKTGLMAGLAYGLLQFVTGPYIYHPLQVLLDYPLAFGCLGLSGVFSKSKHGIIKGYALGVFGRYLCHVISGYIFFKSYAPDGMNPLLYTLGYNATYILPEAIVTIIILSVPVVTEGFNRVKTLANAHL